MHPRSDVFVPRRAPRAPRGSGRGAALLGLVLAACGGDSALSVSPERIDWGEIDFQSAAPEGGFSPRSIAVTNGGKGPATLQLDSFDFERLCLPGFTSVPAEIGEVAAGEDFTLEVGVCGYDSAAGERDQLISGQLRISDTDSGDEVVVEWSFTPVRAVGG